MRQLLRALLRRCSLHRAQRPFYSPNSSSSRPFAEARRAFHRRSIMSGGSTTALLYATVISSSQIAGATPEDASDLKHHLEDGKGFRNPWDSYREWSLPWIIKEMLLRLITGQANHPDTTPPTVPVHPPNFLQTRDTSSLRVTWLGHACFYVEFPGGFRVLFDPVFTARCSPFSFMGPKRYTEAPCDIDAIPHIDAVIISHNHYDHLSHPTVMKIRDLHPNVQFFVPLKTKGWFEKWGVHNVTELDWWETRDIKLSAVPSKDKGPEDQAVVGKAASTSEPQEILATIGCLPCQHTSARTPFDRAHSLWASWSVESGGKKVWFGGDTGYRAVSKVKEGEDDYDPKFNWPHCPAFKQIGDLRGPFDVGLIPIGAYDPRFIMSPMHANPFDSVNIFADTKCKRALGMHWGTWVLTEEEVLEPPRLLKTALKQKGIAEVGVFDVCDIGESREF